MLVAIAATAWTGIVSIGWWQSVVSRLLDRNFNVTAMGKVKSDPLANGYCGEP
jgi:hypothetical protein